MMPTKNNKLLNVKEVAEALRVSERSVFRYIHDGKLKASKVGYWRIEEDDLDKFLQQTSNMKPSKKKK
jgi:excisionase family DNA binding protein